MFLSNYFFRDSLLDWIFFKTAFTDKTQKFFQIGFVPMGVQFQNPVNGLLLLKVSTLGDQLFINTQESIPVSLHLIILLKVVKNCCAIGIRVCDGGFSHLIFFNE